MCSALRSRTLSRGRGLLSSWGDHLDSNAQSWYLSTRVLPRSVFARISLFTGLRAVALTEV